MSLLWTSADMVEAMEGRPVGELPEGVSGISIDSRTVVPGEAFFAIKGDRVDGHSFAGLAAANGASLLVVSEAKLPALGRLTCPMIVVDDVLEAMVMLAAASRTRSEARIVAVTGSVGKTSTKEMIAAGLATSGKVHAAVASFNNHWGVPLTLARMPADAEFGVFEIGMNHAGEIRPLTELVRPHVAVITTIAPAHMGNFASLREIAAAKAEIFEGLEPAGFAVLNRDIDEYEALAHIARRFGAEIVSFGEHSKADFKLLDYRTVGDRGHIQALLAADEPVTFEIGLPGQHMAENALAALAAIAYAGGSVEAAIPALTAAGQLKGRGRRHRLKIGGGSFTLIDESYNANPASMRAALELLGASAGDGRKVAVLGDMLELGSFARDAHEGLAVPLVSAGVTDVWLAGEEMVALKEALPESIVVEYRPNADELADFAAGAVAAGDTVMVKSSLGIGFGAIVKKLLDTYPAEG
ncbi:UDP-N-acetylmuramoyl-tripeptide--D-alanyl-D-alanine ligase [Martelella endophytica]|uniref:UDP-N-acetylmuramoyl-tripeptide--D-alanyl-D-alanine ligase n=2 Tax=Pseudomonadota TaxID=1224 RepID=A0A0D5LUX9_MAREN|nr:UDP-N-acetylmuramoyl-tripeptide--D-alanyl-D-alanine ligase [Martelella endophytica]AJY47178.1 UDP-N-acetylmuramoylalanyl-D-glutamyl-2, 6-diaminopimelate--D-alanyl-D-alanine ligase [Martelella endophytica]